MRYKIFDNPVVVRHVDHGLCMVQHAEAIKLLDRVKQAMKNNMGHVPVARGVDKTHKDGFDNHVGPPLRMIVGANEAPNSQISENLCDILKPLAEKMDQRWKTKLTATEELCAEFVRLNNEDDNGETPPSPDQPPQGPPVPDRPPPGSSCT